MKETTSALIGFCMLPYASLSRRKEAENLEMDDAFEPIRRASCRSAHAQSLQQGAYFKRAHARTHLCSPPIPHAEAVQA